MNNLKTIISEESIIKLSDGTIIKGSEQVTNTIENCCRWAIEGYKESIVRSAITGVALGMICYGTYSLIKNISNNKINKVEKEEA